MVGFSLVISGVAVGRAIGSVARATVAHGEERREQNQNSSDKFSRVREREGAFARERYIRRNDGKGGD